MRARFRRGVKTLAERLGMDVVDDPVYSPVPKVPPPDAAIWDRRSPLHGVAFDLDEQLRLLEEDLAPYIEEFAGEVLDRRGFTLWNGFYQAGDAELLYALLRHLKPARVLELGSGFSTHVSAAAAAVNRSEGAEIELTTVDPAPRTGIERLDGLTRVEHRSALDLPLERFQQLERGDVLFVDTSHAVKLGSEVNWLVLEVLPLLPSGVYVHFHDVFLPYEYPRYLLELGGYFNEQYLLQAFLIENDSYEVVLAACALARERRERTSAPDSEHRRGRSRPTRPALPPGRLLDQASLKLPLRLP